MNLPRLSMSSQQAQIGIQTQRPQLNHQSSMTTLEIKQEQVLLKMETTLPKVTIDQSQCFSESGLKSIMELIAENASYGVSKMQESVGRIAEQGNQLADIGRTAEGAIQSQGVYNAFDQFAVDYNMVTMPKSRPQITLQRGYVNAKPEGGTVQITPKPGSLDLKYVEGKIEFYLKQKNSLNIQVEGGTIDGRG